MAVNLNERTEGLMCNLIEARKNEVQENLSLRSQLYSALKNPLNSGLRKASTSRESIERLRHKEIPYPALARRVYSTRNNHDKVELGSVRYLYVHGVKN